MDEVEVTGAGLDGYGNPCPQCGGKRTHRTWLRWADGREVTFWSCDACWRTWGREEVEAGQAPRR